MRRENILENVWLGGREGKMMMGPGCFLLGLPKSFLPKMWRKLVGENLIANDKNAHVQVSHGHVHCSFYFYFYFSIPVVINVFFFGYCSFFLYIYIYILFYHQMLPIPSSFQFFFFRLFFFQICFLFFNKFWWLYFFGCLSHFCFNWAPYFNKGVYE